MTTAFSIQDFQTICNKAVGKEVYTIGPDISEAIKEQSGEDNPSALDQKSPTPESFIFETLGHIPVNPSEPENIDLLDRVFEYVSSTTEPDWKYPNHNYASADKFLDDLMEAAQLEADVMQGKAGFGLSGRPVYLLNGPRGIGKTFFLNHLFATRSPKMDHRKCIWIRINLIDQFGGAHQMYHTGCCQSWL